MRHVHGVSKHMPVTAALLPENHPPFEDSVKGFLEDPIGTIRLHLDKED